MKFIRNEDLKVNLIQIDRRKAEDWFYENSDNIYIKINGKGYLVTDNADEHLMPTDQFTKLFIESKKPKFDDTKLIVTRHKVIADYFRQELGINAKHIEYARIYEVRGKDVYGCIPLAFMTEVNSLTVAHGKERDADKIDAMTVEEFKNQLISVRKYNRVEYQEIDFKHLL